MKLGMLIFVTISLMLLALCATAETDQRPGVDGDFGKVYSIGKGTPLNFIMINAEYSVQRIHIGEEDYVPAYNEKLLVIHFSLQNPAQTEAGVDNNTIRFTAVGENQANYEYINNIGIEGTGVVLDSFLKPAQKIAAYTAFIIPSDSVIPKIMVLPAEDDAPVIRYQSVSWTGATPPKSITKTINRIQSIKAPFARANDVTGAAVVEEIPANIGNWYSSGLLDLRLDALNYSEVVLPDEDPLDGEKYAVFTISVRNQSITTQGVYGGGHVIPKVILSDDGEANWNNLAYLVKSPRIYEGDILPGKEMQYRFFFRIPNEVPVTTLQLTEWGFITQVDENKSRPLIYNWLADQPVKVPAF